MKSLISSDNISHGNLCKVISKFTINLLEPFDVSINNSFFVFILKYFENSK